ncbi:MAG: asparagine synthase (glutamine-hydrolyzing) [Clostridia bacterium]|nr:asparagine synthase (glutamine-hydrolyzing) [Clostridia bacterium]
MCGFCGFTGKVENREQVIENMMEKIIYRGPDSKGTHIDDDICLGFRRLSIIDLADGTQPIYNEDGTKVIVFNGEIYNYQGIREDLISKGHKFKTKTDTEVILHGYEEYGPEVLNKFRGMFGIAIWDLVSKELFIARDFFGIKPMYYTQVGNDLIFGSEIKCILTHPNVKKELNESALQNYLSFQYGVPNETFFKNIYCLQPGHYLKFKDGKLEITRYWTPEFKVNDSWEEEGLVEEIDKVFKESVEAHKISDVEVGCFLSSGVDSSYVATQFKGQKSFTVGFNYNKYNEIDYAKELAEEIGQDHYFKRIEDDEFWEIVPQVQYYMDQPHADPSCVALYYVCKIASEHVKVVLSGEGADELFGGYRIYHEPFSLRYSKFLPRFVWKGIAGVLNAIPVEFPGKSYANRASKTLEQRFIGNANLFSDKEKRKILRNTEGMKKPEEITKPFYDDTKGMDDVTRMQYIDINLWMIGDILLKADRMSMANSLELRVPFLDKEVWNLARTIPTKYKVTKDGKTKVAMRKAALKNMPEKVASRKKLGFPVPTREWLKQEKYYNIVKKEFESETAKKYFVTEEIVKLLDEHIQLKKDNSRKIWTIYVFLIWYKQFFGEN